LDFRFHLDHDFLANASLLVPRSHSGHKTRIPNPNILILNPYILNPKNLIMYSGCCFKYPNIFQRIQAYSLGTRIS
jgi:hypothetical protein